MPMRSWQKNIGPGEVNFIPSAIRKIQRAGRTARLKPGSLKILITKNTRDQAYYYVSNAKEKKMHTAIDEIKKEMSENTKQKELF